MDVLANVRAQRGHLYDDGGQRSCTTAAYGVLYVGEHGKYSHEGCEDAAEHLLAPPVAALKNPDQ